MKMNFFSRRTMLVAAGALVLVVAALAIAQISTTRPKSAPVTWRFAAPVPDTVPAASYQARVTCVSCDSVYFADVDRFEVDPGPPVEHVVSLTLRYYQVYQVEFRAVSAAGVPGGWSPISDEFEFLPPWEIPQR